MVFNSNKYIPLTDSTNTETNPKKEMLDDLKKRIKVVETMEAKSNNHENESGNSINSCEIGVMKENPYFTVEIVNFPPEKSILLKNQKINNILSKEKLENAIHVQQKVVKSLNTEEGSTTHSSLHSQEMSQKFFNFLNRKDKIPRKNSLQNINLTQVGPFKEVKIYSKSPLSFNNCKTEYINLNLKEYFKFPHKSISYEKSKLFSSLHKQFQLSLDSVFNDFIEFNNEFYILLGKEIILFSNKKAYVANTLKMKLINNDIEFSQLQKDNPILINEESYFNQLLMNKELIINNSSYLIVDDINMELLVDHLLNSDTLPFLPFIFSTHKFDNSIIYTPNVRALGVIKDNSGIKYGYKLSGYGLIEDIIHELTNKCLDNCEKRTKEDEICNVCLELNKKIQFIFQ